uniref:sugar phosphate nucleotidyltransferase n=1 Tax=Agathobacter sp. TaxID=2021311 RepID=UPI004056A23E
MDYIIVQAGGMGTRLEYLTKNKPKALVPVDNLPMLFHLFRKYKDKQFIIIADYKKEVLKKYLAVFAEVKYQIIETEEKGTCAGIWQALTLIPEKESFMLVWSDLILPKKFQLPEEYEKEGTILNDYVGISVTFPCRWSYFNNVFSEEKSCQNGVAGFFLFTDKTKLENVPKSGELVRWMQQEGMVYKRISLAGTKEFGALEEYQKLEREKSRPFNRITIYNDMLVKEAIDKQGEMLAVREGAWYKNAIQKGIDIIPEIYGYNPLKMEYIKGKNIYEYNLAYEEKRSILRKLISSLKLLHESEKIKADLRSIKEAYFNKTIERLEKIQDLVPFANDREIVINGKRCRNIFYQREVLEQRIEQISCDKFCFIHGDCTFSNMMLREDGTIVLIDPRGYFGFTELYGDPKYDWAKMYYSIKGNYDKFNLKKFLLKIEEKEVFLKIDSNNWEDMESDFFEMIGADRKEIELLHAIIWLSLTTYAWHDYDSICGAFYNGLYYLEDLL